MQSANNSTINKFEPKNTIQKLNVLASVFLFSSQFIQ